MRILKVTETYAPFLEHGGPPVKVRALAEGLARRGHHVTVLTADWGIAGRNDFAPIEPCPWGLRRFKDGVEAVYLPTRLRYRTVTWNPSVARFCRERIRDFDVAHIYGLYDLLGPRVASACRAADVPYVVEPIGMYRPIVRNVLLKWVYHGVLGRRMIEGAHGVIATSEQEVSELVAGETARARVVLRRNGVEVPAVLPPRNSFRASCGIPPSDIVILFLGRLVSKKSPDLLLRAFAMLSEGQGLRRRLVFAGPDEDGMKRALEKQARELGVGERVHFPGPIFGDAKWAAYRDANVFVLPSQNENFGNTAAEAVAAGIPVIVTDTCGIARLLRDGAGVIVPHEVGALAEALERVLSDAPLRDRLRAGGAALLPRLGWEEPVQEMENLYESLARRASADGQSRPPA